MNIVFKIFKTLYSAGAIIYYQSFNGKIILWYIQLANALSVTTAF